MAGAASHESLESEVDWGLSVMRASSVSHEENIDFILNRDTTGVSGENCKERVVMWQFRPLVQKHMKRISTKL